MVLIQYYGYISGSTCIVGRSLGYEDAIASALEVSCKDYYLRCVQYVCIERAVTHPTYTILQVLYYVSSLAQQTWSPCRNRPAKESGLNFPRRFKIS